MLTFLEYRVLRQYSFYPDSTQYNPVSETTGNLTRNDFIRADINKKIKIKECLVDSISDKLIEWKYLTCNADITSLGKAELHLFWWNLIKHFADVLCKVYAPLVISILALVLSFIAFARNN